MEQNIVNPTVEEQTVDAFVSRISLEGTFLRTITRFNGEIDRKAIPNVVTALGLDHLADRATADTGSKYGWIAIGTANYTAHINSQEIGECSRKTAAIMANSRNLIVAIATWGGSADSVTSNSIQMCGICNHQTSGSGHKLNVAAGVSTVLANSDFLHLEVQVQVGSHAIAT